METKAFEMVSLAAVSKFPKDLRKDALAMYDLARRLRLGFGCKDAHSMYDVAMRGSIVI